MNKSNYRKLKYLLFKVFILFISTAIAIWITGRQPNIQWPPKVPQTSLNITSPFLEEKVSMRMLGIILATVYLTLMFTFILLYKLILRKILILADFLICSLISYSILIIVFKSIKLYFAVPRPNFLAVCIPNALGFCDISTPQRKKKVFYGFTSFPSCHSATITYFGILLIIVMVTRPIAITIRTSCGHKFYIIYCGVSIIINLLSIVFVCLSRIWDFYHRIVDVIVGILLGIIFFGIMIPIKNRVFKNFYNKA